MRISFYSLKINLVSGGGSHYTLDLKLRYLLARGHQVSLTTLYAGENKFSAKPPYPVRECGFQGGFLEMQKYTRDLLKQDENKADIFHIDGQSFLWGAGMYKKTGGKVPAVAFINNYPAGMGIVHKDRQALSPGRKAIGALRDKFYIKKRYLWEKLIGLKYANELDAILLDSPVIKEIFEDFGFKKEKLQVLPEFLDIEELLKIPTKKTAPFKKERAGFYLLYAGRLTFDKGVDLLIKTLKDTAEKENIFLNIVGDGPQKEYLEELTGRLNLKNNIRFFSWSGAEQLAQFYAHSDLLVHPCRWPEPFGRTIVEAMAFGKPIITASRSGSAWVMSEAGLTFKNNSADDLKNKILFLKNDPASRQQFGSAAKIRAKEFDYRLFTGEFESLLLKLARKN